MRPVDSIEELDRNIVTLCKGINAATYELLVLVRQSDERAGWLKWGVQSCAKWLAWRCDLSVNTALEKVRVAHALKTLPEISAAFSTGELSYSKVRAMTRVANKETESSLLAFALRHTATQVAERCRELRWGNESSIDCAARAYANRSLRIRRDSRRGMMVVTVELPIDTGELLETALDKARDDEVLKIPDLTDTSWSMRQADAFTTMVSNYLSGGESHANDNYLVTVHVDQSALAGGGGRSALPIESVKRLCCDGHAVVVTEDGGETNLGNLMLLCTKHHTLVHEGGFRIEKDFTDRWYFMRPDGIAVPSCGNHARDMLDEDTGEVSNSYEIPPAGGMLSVAERTVSEPAAPAYLH
jgi:hypothetical protein